MDTLLHDIATLEASLERPSAAADAALAESVVAAVADVGPGSPPAEREVALRGLLAANHQLYRQGEVARSGVLLRAAVVLSQGLEPRLRLAALQRCAEHELLVFDVGAALEHTAIALELAHAAGLRAEEARAWTNYGLALASAGLHRQADAHWAHALELLGDIDDARARGNAWALRCPLGLQLGPDEMQAAVKACDEALACALAAPGRFRDSMACTALCNRAALEIQRGRVGEARERLRQAAALENLGVRPRWLVSVLQALADIRERDDPAAREALAALLAPDRAPAVYVIETWSVMAATFAAMGETARAAEALERVSAERVRALWALVRGGGVAAAGAPGSLARAATVDPMALLERLAVVAELRDDATGKHCYRVGRLALRLAQRAGLPAADLEELEIAARLHDIGKIAIPDAILLKPGALNPAELHLMRKHSALGAGILAGDPQPRLQVARSIAQHHHERWNGTGYPDGLAGEAIPLVARVTALADVYDALTHDRPYKAAWSHDRAMGYIASMRGEMFDPRLTDHFLALMAEAREDWAAFLGDLESAAAGSPFALALDRAKRARADEAGG